VRTWNLSYKKDNASYDVRSYTIMPLLVAWKEENTLTSWETISFSRRTDQRLNGKGTSYLLHVCSLRLLHGIIKIKI
jgi:hypothetical protein